MTAGGEECFLHTTQYNVEQLPNSVWENTQSEGFSECPVRRSSTQHLLNGNAFGWVLASRHLYSHFPPTDRVVPLNSSLQVENHSGRVSTMRSWAQKCFHFPRLDSILYTRSPNIYAKTKLLLHIYSSPLPLRLAFAIRDVNFTVSYETITKQMWGISILRFSCASCPKNSGTAPLGYTAVLS